MIPGIKSMNERATRQVTTGFAPAQVSGSQVSGVLQRKCAACGNHTMAGSECRECGKKRQFGLQTKLKVSEPGDAHEQEADRVADQVLAAPAHSSVSVALPRIQSFTGQSIGQVNTAPASVDHILAGSGRPLDLALQQEMGQRFGHDFSQVRVHTGTTAEQSTREVNAHAYTVGSNIVFGTGQFAPGSNAGRRLIAHELTHVVQQNGSSHTSNLIQRSVGANSNCPESVHNAPVDPITRLTLIDARAQTMALGSSHLLFFESVLFNDPTFGPSNVFDAYRDWFGTPEQTSSGRWRSRFHAAIFETEDEAIAHELQTFSERFEKIYRWMSRDIRYRCPGTNRYTIPGCGSGVCRHDAEACPGSRTIAICPTFWTGATDDGRASLLLHESIHALFKFRSHPTADVRGRSRNPYCYQGFVDTIYNTGSLPLPGRCSVI